MHIYEKMPTYRRRAIIVGILFIVATAFLFIGKAVYTPFLGSADYLEVAYPNRIKATMGILLEFACVLSIPLIPIFLFPILKKQNEPLALAYVVFRFFEAVLFILVEINTLSLIGVSEQYLASGANASYFQSLGRTIQVWNEWGFSFYVIVFTIGALMFYAVLYQSKLVPRFLSGWGFFAAALMLAGSVLILLEVEPLASSTSFELLVTIPIAVNEMVLALWLIFKGFNLSEVEKQAQYREKRPLIAH